MCPVVMPDSVISWMDTAAQYSWFIGMGLGLVVYSVLARSSSVTATSLVPDEHVAATAVPAEV